MKWTKKNIQYIAKQIQNSCNTNVSIYEFTDSWSLTIEDEVNEQELASILNAYMDEDDYLVESRTFVTIYKHY